MGNIVLYTAIVNIHQEIAAFLFWRRDRVSLINVSTTEMAPQASQPPEPFSLNGLLRKHCHDRLYVHPLHWTAQHLQLLNCRFFHCQPLPPPASSTQAYPPPGESEQPREDSKLDKQQPKHGQDINLKAARRLAFSPHDTAKELAMRELLSDYAISWLQYVSLRLLPTPIPQESVSHPTAETILISTSRAAQ
jgi:hypothetical protein